MAVETHADRRPTWRDPEACPFCGSALADGGPGFIDHLGHRPDCEAGFEVWRERVADDIGAGWTG